VLSQAVIAVKFGAGPKFTSAVVFELQLVSEVCGTPVSSLSCLRIFAEPWSAVV
jgi:hypothetical protein